jgi:hypothetical protein
VLRSWVLFAEDIATTECTVTGLTAATTYSFRVGAKRASSTAGYTFGAASANVTTLTDSEEAAAVAAEAEALQKAEVNYAHDVAGVPVCVPGGR